MRQGKYRKSIAYLYETISSTCPYCGEIYVDKEVGWRDKPQEDGLSFYPATCQKCLKRFWLNYNYK